MHTKYAFEFVPMRQKRMFRKPRTHARPVSDGPACHQHPLPPAAAEHWPPLALRESLGPLNIKTEQKLALNILRVQYAVYKQYIRPLLTRAHSTWRPINSATKLAHLQAIQNVALPIGSKLKSDRLHQKKVLIFGDRMDMGGSHRYTCIHILHRAVTPTSSSHTGRTSQWK